MCLVYLFPALSGTNQTTVKATLQTVLSPRMKNALPTLQWAKLNVGKKGKDVGNLVVTQRLELRGKCVI